MANKYIDGVLPQMKALKEKMDRHEDIPGSEIRELREAINRASTDPFPSQNDLKQTPMFTPCPACALCGLMDPPFLGFLSAL